MATPETRVEETLDIGPDLRVIQGGGALAVEQTVQAAPAIHELPLHEFQLAVHELIRGDQSNKSPLELEQVRADLEAVRSALSEASGDLAIRIHELSQEFDLIIKKKIWVNGYLKDPKNFS